MLIGNMQVNMLDLIDMGLVAFVVYFVLRLIRGTHAEQMLIGLALMFVLYEVSRTFGLLTVEWIFDQVFSVFIVILVVLFQAEIRKGLMRVAVNPLAVSATPRDELIAAVVKATSRLMNKRWGALIVFEREAGLKHLDESGVLLHSRADAELMLTLFSPSTPLHDGAIVIALNEENLPEIRSARVLLPLAKSKNVDGDLGTRHRAAIGLTEENDALVLVVSEERGDVHLVENGELGEALDAKALKSALTKKLVSMKANGKSKL